LKIRRLFCSFLILFLLFSTSCRDVKKEENALSDIKLRYNQIKDFVVEADVTVKMNKYPESFHARIYYKYPEKERIEIYKGGDLDKIIIYNKEKVFIYFKKINRSVIIENQADEDKHYLLLSNFIKNIMTSERIDLTTEKNYYYLYYEVPDGNIYFAKEAIWIDKKNFLPVKMSIYNLKGEEVVTATYAQFLANKNLSDDVFEINTRN